LLVMLSDFMMLLILVMLMMYMMYMMQVVLMMYVALVMYVLFVVLSLFVGFVYGPVVVVCCSVMFEDRAVDRAVMFKLLRLMFILMVMFKVFLMCVDRLMMFHSHLFSMLRVELLTVIYRLSMLYQYWMMIDLSSSLPVFH